MSGVGKYARSLLRSTLRSELLRVKDSKRAAREYPRSSIRHRIDNVMKPGVGLNFSKSFRFLRDHGLTSEVEYPYNGNINENQFHGGKCYRFSSFEPIVYDITNKEIMDELGRQLDRDGPVVAAYTPRTTHENAELLTLEGETSKDGITSQHVVLSAGHNNLTAIGSI